jgi:hypothetical protein
MLRQFVRTMATSAKLSADGRKYKSSGLFVTKLLTVCRAALSSLQGWKESSAQDAIEKEYKFKDFKTAWSWMSAVARYADEV